MPIRCGKSFELRATGAGCPGTIGCMRPPQLIDMSSPRFNVERMSKMIQIRNVPDEMHRMLKAAAAREGMSLSDYLKRELVGVGARSDLERIDARIRARGPSGLKTEDIVRTIREHRGE